MLLRYVLLALGILTLVPQLSAADRYFYSRGGEAYYCKQPVRYSEGCYIVRDNTDVVRVDQYPVISNARAVQMIQSVAPVDSASCCPEADIPVNCVDPPQLAQSCRCSEKCPTVPISRPFKGLRSNTISRSFYKTIGTFEGTIPVPEIEIVKSDAYDFRAKKLSYDCEQSGEHQCTSDCVVKACEVFQKREVCEKRCEMRERSGPLLIAVRTETAPGGGAIIDVFIGNVGASAFPEYPTNLAVLKGRDIQFLRDKLGLPNFDLSTDVRDLGDTDLLKHL